ncbi:acyl carrier protein [bacterium (Candidatus Blackallbacteria) CG17_big_fil_post_rev_8_21_14_2_50_48_46]|uniref:Acyl carrier protein n=1 Tax=bacterium (Candidatus Blackallbacteria) CG17_big_fil_post_rev_8_21_14_2_50_48_46 TaxID=2014261 RepID=A0A2M7G243_9BACT|nr:MAG: acyl carrier protein [bacterium (Candidatus Blackallbacteria) CG18_big_fil_WC_8_21_14_2_50_49_26]PIW15420.1 MAG: acyl carrier protein [bacterium (Candidatus Blackallbacteria) CG17_big_fil_post_rev_8_21_14_2_50_48_46]PIW49719.1 MAG: acyl carrier protein [bacterium (Candidatus Blackallbacteria) CG13_big_fil_rev_8_21_14_2_50_49_14]
MSKDEILEKIRSIVVEQLGVEASQVTPDANFINDLGADSLGTVELIMSLEEAFDIDIPDDKAEQIRTVGDALVYIEQHA